MVYIIGLIVERIEYIESNTAKELISIRRKLKKLELWFVINKNNFMKINNHNNMHI